MEVLVSDCWIEGKVDRSREHIVITYSSAPEDREKRVAYIMPITSNAFVVQFLSSLRKKENKEIYEAVKLDLDSYLVKKAESNPWKYAQYHCTTTANEYSKVHWRLYSCITNSSI